MSTKQKKRMPIYAAVLCLFFAAAFFANAPKALAEDSGAEANEQETQTEEPGAGAGDAGEESGEPEAPKTACEEAGEHLSVVTDNLVPATTKADGLTKGSRCAECGAVIKAQETIPRIKSVTLKKTAYTYDGKAKKPGVTVKDSAGKVISDTYYKVAWSGNKKLGSRAVATITFKGNYKGTVKRYFYINGWQKKNGRSYYYLNAKKAQSRFVTIGGKTYYFGKDKAMATGWMKKGSNYYFLDRSSGVRRANCTVDGIRLKKDGTAKKTSYNVKKIKTMMKARSILNSITKPTDSKKQKLKKSFDWVLKHPYKRYRILPEARQKKDWLMTYAGDIYKKNGKGCCVSEACAFAFLAHECGYKNVYVCDDTSHAWAEIGGRVYDTLFAESKSYKRYYNSTYKTAKLHRINRTKI